MDQERPESAAAIQAGKRPSSLGGLTKPNPATKFKSMFDSKGPGPEIKESGLLSKLRPIYASHDANSLAAALSRSMSGQASLRTSLNGSLQQPSLSPTAPLFIVPQAPAEKDALPIPTPPRTAEELQLTVVVYNDPLPNESDSDVRSAKSAESAGFPKRMGSGLEKVLTPGGKQKLDGLSPRCAGSEASDLIPRSSGQLDQSVTPTVNGSAPHGDATQTSLQSRSRDVSPRPSLVVSQDQNPSPTTARASGLPMTAEGSLVCTGSITASLATMARGIAADDIVTAVSLAVSPRVVDCNDGPHGIPPMRALYIGAENSSHRTFPHLPSTELDEYLLHAVQGVTWADASQIADGNSAFGDASAGIDMAACNLMVPHDTPLPAVPSSEEVPITSATTGNCAAAPSMANSVIQQTPHVRQVIGCSAGAAGSLNMELRGAITKDSDSSDADKETIPGSCIFGKQFDLPTMDALKDLQLQEVVADMPGQFVKTDSSFCGAGLNITGAHRVTGTAGTEGAKVAGDEYSRTEPCHVSTSQVYFVEASAPVDVLEIVPAGGLQPAAAGTDFMHMDKSGAYGQSYDAKPPACEVESTRQAGSQGPNPGAQGPITYGAAVATVGDVTAVFTNIQVADSPAISVLPTVHVKVQASIAHSTSGTHGNDSSMVSPTPQRLGTPQLALPLTARDAIPRMSQDIGARAIAPCTAPSAVASSVPESITPETARLGVRAFQLDDIEEPEISVEAQAEALEVALQVQLPSHDHGAAEHPVAFGLPLESISPAIDGMIITAVTSATTANGFVDGGAVLTSAPNTPTPVELLDSASASGITSSAPSGSAPPAHSGGVDVSVADSLEAIVALWGNDDLLVVSSPVSACKQGQSSVLSHSGRKVAPGVVLEVQRESLDLFSLRNSCAARVSDSLMVESLDSFESMGICAKSRAVGFIPMAPLKEGDEDAAVVGRTTSSEGGVAPASAGPQSPKVTFAIHSSGPLGSNVTPGTKVAGSAASTGSGAMLANKSGACRLGVRCVQASTTTASQAKAAGSANKMATPVSAARTNATPPTALKAMATANAAGSSASKVGIPKRSLSVATPQTRQLSTPGQPSTGPSAPSSGSRLPGFAATPGAVNSRAAAPTPGSKPPLQYAATTVTPSAAPARPSITPHSALAFSSGKAQGRSGPVAQQPMPVGRTGTGSRLFGTSPVLPAAAGPGADRVLPGCEFGLDTVDISTEVSKAIPMLGGGDSSNHHANAVAQHTTSELASVRVTTPSVLEMHVQLLTNKLAAAEASIQKLQDDNAMLRDQVSTLQFENSMTNDLDMEREARQFLEQELCVMRHRSDGLEADLRAAHAELKRREHAAAELLAAQQAKEAEWARQEAEMQLQMQQMASEVEVARSFAQQANARIAEAEARAAAATTKCDEETICNRELRMTLGLQAHQLLQMQRARDDAEANFQQSKEQLIAVQTSYKKAVAEYEQKLQQSNSLLSQVNDIHDKYRQMKQHAANAEHRAQHAEAKAQEATAAFVRADLEKDELMQMCNQLLTQLEAAKVRVGR